MYCMVLLLASCWWLNLQRQYVRNAVMYHCDTIIIKQIGEPLQRSLVIFYKHVLVLCSEIYSWLVFKEYYCYVSIDSCELVFYFHLVITSTLMKNKLWNLFHLLCYIVHHLLKSRVEFQAIA